MPMTTTFVPSASITISPTEFSTAFALPAVDGSNPDLLITVSTFTDPVIQLGTSATVIAGPAGSIQLHTNQIYLITNNPAVIAAEIANPLVLSGGNAAIGATATYIAVSQQMRGGSITVSRGKATSAATF